MPEAEYPVKTVKVFYECDRCGSRDLKYQGTQGDSNFYVCRSCDYQLNLPEFYPKIKHYVQNNEP